jgi:hypothetical protein
MATLLGPARGFGYRFACAYVTIYHLAVPNGLPGSEWLGNQIGAGELAAVKWLAGLIGVDVPNGPNGSGDTRFNYLELVPIAALAALAAAIWHRVRTPERDARVDAVTRVFLRYVTAYFMLDYGLIKVAAMQMAPLGPLRLAERIGDLSPMGMLWTFIGSSPAYEMFCGAAETLGGVLLLWRRTTPLGALVTCATMINVVALNFCYDVPVKLFSMHMVATGAFLLVPDLARLAGAVLGQAVPARPAEPRAPRWRRVAKLLVLGYLVGWDLGKGVVDAYFERGGGAPRSPLYGSYTVESLVRDGRPDSAWRDVLFDPYAVGVVEPDGTRRRAPADYDAAKGTLALGRGQGAAVVTRPDAERLVLSGVLFGHLVEARVKRLDEGKWLLTSRGFHWINEQPFNR